MIVLRDVDGQTVGMLSLQAYLTALRSLTCLRILRIQIVTRSELKHLNNSNSPWSLLSELRHGP